MKSVSQAKLFGFKGQGHFQNLNVRATRFYFMTCVKQFCRLTYRKERETDSNFPAFFVVVCGLYR